MAGKKELTIDLRLKEIIDKDDKTQKHGKRTLRTVKFVGKDEDVIVSLKAEKSIHPLKKWTNNMLDEEEDMVMLLELPTAKQKKIDDFADD